MALPKIPPNNGSGWDFSQPYGLFEHFKIATLKEFIRFHSLPGTETKGPGKFIQLGGGKKSILGVQNFDLPEWNAETDPLPHAEASVDGIFTYNMLDHIRDPRRVLLEAGRVLKDGGAFVCIVPHYMSELAHSCFDHKSQFAVDSWRNALDNKHDPSQRPIPFDLGFNMIMGLEERNLFLVTQMIRKCRDDGA